MRYEGPSARVRFRASGVILLGIFSFLGLRFVSFQFRMYTVSEDVSGLWLLSHIIPTYPTRNLWNLS